MYKFDPQKTLLLDGSRAKQAVRGSKKSKDSKLTSEKKLAAYDAFHPCFGLTDNAFRSLLEKINPPLWRGYEMGFVRSACWCCPGQCGKQAFMLNKYYPGLAEEIRWWEKRIGALRPLENRFFDNILRAGQKQLKVDDLNAIVY